MKNVILKDGRKAVIDNSNKPVITDLPVVERNGLGELVPVTQKVKGKDEPVYKTLDTSKFVMASIEGGGFQPLNKNKIAKTENDSVIEVKEDVAEA